VTPSGGGHLALAVVVPVLAACAAVQAPLLTYAVSLGLFGVPHVVVELRYVDRAFAPRLDLRLIAGVLAGLAMIALVRAAGIFGLGAFSHRVQLELVVGTLLVALVVGFAGRGATRATVGAVLVVLALGAGAFLAPVTTLVVLAFAHNLTPLGFLADGLRGRARTPGLVAALVVFVVVPVAIASGSLGSAVGPWAFDPEGPAGIGPLEQHLGVFVPPALLTEDIAFDLFRAAAYLQCMHYAVVLHVLPRLAGDPPAEERVAPQLLDRLGQGAPVTILGAASAVAFVLAFGETRALYGVVASVHAWVEIPVLLAALSLPRPSCEASPA
jgi:hypothetical protein